MPVLRVSAETLELIGRQVPRGYGLRNEAKRRQDGKWDLPVDSDVAAHVAANRLSGESDDDTISRLVRAAIAQKAD